jgi:putative transcriptional regulator
MSKRGERLVRSAKQALAFARGEANTKHYRVHVPADIDVKAIRRGLKMTQDEFAVQFGFTINQIRDWEQSRSRPHHADRAYLKVIARRPEVVQEVLAAA